MDRDQEAAARDYLHAMDGQIDPGTRRRAWQRFLSEKFSLTEVYKQAHFIATHSGEMEVMSHLSIYLSIYWGGYGLMALATSFTAPRPRAKSQSILFQENVSLGPLQNHYSACFDTFLRIEIDCGNHLNSLQILIYPIHVF